MIVKERVPAIMFAGDAVFFEQQLPTMFSQCEYVQVGGLMSYGDLWDFCRRTHRSVGANSGYLPIEQPTKFHLVINRWPLSALRSRAWAFSG